MPDYNATTQMLAMVRRLQHTRAGALPVNRLAEELEVHRRTVTRWLKVLERDWLDDDERPIVRREHRGREAWAVLTGASSMLTANLYQYAATLAGMRHLEAGGDSVLSAGSHDVLQRVEDGMSKSMREHLPRVLQCFHYVPFAPKDYSGSDDTLDRLLAALVHRHPVQLDYTNAAERTSHQRLEPWSMVMYRDGFYLLARHVGSEALLLYAVERMSEVVLDRSETFEVPKGFRPEAEFGRNLGLWRTHAVAERVIVAFEPDVASNVRARRWPGFKSLSDAEDGRLLLELEVPITPEIKGWVLGWGATAEVLEPAELREHVAAEMIAAAKRYA